MTREEAKKVLNQTREGVGAWTGDQIRDALTATGDLGAHEGLRSEALVETLPGDRLYLGWSAGSTVVAASLRRH
jgi:hypothetical protein